MKRKGPFDLENRAWNSDIFTWKNVPAALVLFLCILTLAVCMALNFRPLYYMDIKLLKISETSGYSAEEIKQNYDALIDYNNLFFSGKLEFPTMKMSDSARIHFEDVKKVFTLFEIGMLVALPVAAAMIIIMHKRKSCGYLAMTAALTVGIPAVLGLLIALDWQSFFVRFHEIVFRNDYWLFDPQEDPVITILPDAFFMHCAILILVLMAVGSLTCLWFYRMRSKKQLD